MKSGGEKQYQGTEASLDSTVDCPIDEHVIECDATDASTSGMTSDRREWTRELVTKDSPRDVELWEFVTYMEPIEDTQGLEPSKGVGEHEMRGHSVAREPSLVAE